MQAQHKEVFFSAAEKYTCWIGLREPNPLAEKWIGRSGYLPKPLTCKAKSSDNPDFQFAGLVADPTRLPDAFLPHTRYEAEAKWREFMAGGRLPVGYSLVDRGAEAGLVQLQGQFLLADFDLMAVNSSNRDGEFLPTTTEMQKVLFDQVSKMINLGLRTPMIQHGAEMMPWAGVGARATEHIFWFGPGHRFQLGISSMPTADNTRH